MEKMEGGSVVGGGLRVEEGVVGVEKKMDS